MRIFVLEDNLERNKKFRRELIGHEIIITEDVESAKNYINIKFDLLFLDHDLGGQEMVISADDTGYGVAKLLNKSINKDTPAIIHSCNHAGATAMQFYLPQAKLIPFPNLNIPEIIYFFTSQLQPA